MGGVCDVVRKSYRLREDWWRCWSQWPWPGRMRKNISRGLQRSHDIEAFGEPLDLERCILNMFHESYLHRDGLHLYRAPRGMRGISTSSAIKRESLVGEWVAPPDTNKGRAWRHTILRTKNCSIDPVLYRVDLLLRCMGIWFLLLSCLRWLTMKGCVFDWIYTKYKSNSI